MKINATERSVIARIGGFTLAELLMAVLVISIIMVALAPVITKRVTDNVKINVFKHDGQLFLYDLHDPNCKPAEDGQNSVDCTFKPPQGIKQVSVIMVSGGGGGAGATEPTWLYNENATASSSTNGVAAKKEIIITERMKNVTIKYMTGGGGGGGAGAYKSSEGRPQSQADCPMNSIFVANSDNKNVCVTKFNVGDPNGPPIPPSITTVNIKETCTAKSAGTPCCWKGQTASTTSCEDEFSYGSFYSNYSGCNRTVCTWPAAVIACSEYAPAGSGTKPGDWRTPESGETNYSNWGAASKYLGSEGLQLCGTSKGYGSIQCQAKYNSKECYGSQYGDCEPEYYWTRISFAQGISGDGRSYSNGAGACSARCVLPKVALKYKSSGGGGGSSAPYLKTYPIPENIIKDNVGGKIVMYAGKGGKGASAPSAPDTDAPEGGAGEGSYLYVYDKDGNYKWGIVTASGKGGEKTIPGSLGKGGMAITSNPCQILDSNKKWQTVSCSTGIKGTDGKVNTVFSSETIDGGSGGGSFYNSSSQIGAGMGGNTGYESGTDATIWGAGGGGGTARIAVGSDGDAVAYNGKGGNGANGIVEITYGEVLPAAGGGGGGGGAFAKISNLKVEPTKEYIVRVGGGGIAGGVSMPGGNGGESYIQFESGKLSVSGGQKGNAGTAQTASTEVLHGAGGLGSSISSLIAGKADDYNDGKNGESGSDGIDEISGRINASKGGVGGASGIGTQGGCGGLVNDSDVCSNTNVSASALNFLTPGNVFDQANYGSAGAGGGGGGWNIDTSRFPNPGSGAQGLNGYVYIYWTKHD